VHDVAAPALRATEIQAEIQRETGKYIRHSLRSANGSTPGSTNNTNANNGTPNAPSPKDAAIPAKVAADYAAIDALAIEKTALAQRLVTLITRSRARLDHDLARVLVLQGELAPALQHAYTSMAAGAAVAGRGPAGAITDSLRHALAGTAPADTPFATRHASPAAPAPAMKSESLSSSFFFFAKATFFILLAFTPGSSPYLFRPTPIPPLRLLLSSSLSPRTCWVACAHQRRYHAGGHSYTHTRGYLIFLSLPLCGVTMSTKKKY
jgi:hypothetical protein